MIVIPKASDERTVPCCDVCDPSLLDCTRPGPKPGEARRKRITRCPSDLSIELKLDDWRYSVYHRDHSGQQFDSSGILSDKLIQDLASMPQLVVCSEAGLKGLLGHTWIWWERYADELLAYLKSLQWTPSTEASTVSQAAQVPDSLDVPLTTTSLPTLSSSTAIESGRAAPHTTENRQPKRPRTPQDPAVSSSQPSQHWQAPKRPRLNSEMPPYMGHSLPVSIYIAGMQQNVLITANSDCDDSWCSILHGASTIAFRSSAAASQSILSLSYLA